jgi:hypothetical protein
LLVLPPLALLLIVASIFAETSCRSSDRQRFADLYYGLAGFEESHLEVTDGHQNLKVILEDNRGLQVAGHLRAPAEGGERFPALLLLGGFGTGRHSIAYIPPTRGVILFALDYPYEGKKSGLSVLEFATSLPAMRRAIINTVPAAMLAVDYLLARPDVDPDRVVLVAGSVGALFAPAIAATDTRIAGLALLFGGGDIQSLLVANAKDDLGWFTRPGAWLGKILTCPVEPLHHIADVSPRPVFMLNGTEDVGIPEYNSRLLYDAAIEPKTTHWIDAGHVVLQDQQFHNLVAQELVVWLVGQGFVTSDAFVGTTP